MVVPVHCMTGFKSRLPPKIWPTASGVSDAAILSRSDSTPRRCRPPAAAATKPLALVRLSPKMQALQVGKMALSTRDLETVLRVLGLWVRISMYVCLFNVLGTN